ncbi:hypothetical protein C0J50_24070 [Silurus asotus]|uniref:Uncharacterized protein n=1 Tax=Silurus asotus TaxID=30991 RepID=A0AAD5FHS9_SILAS|nr:hypothetical protein C0J50_24070 [Silurus asotus]
MTGKGREVADMMERRKVDMYVQETKWKGSKTKNIKGGFKLFYYGVDEKRNGVGVMLKEEYSNSVVEVKRVSDRLMNVKLEVEGMMINGISAYAPQVGCEMEEKEKFWSELDEVVDGVPTNKRVLIGADFIRHVDEGNRGDGEMMDLEKAYDRVPKEELWYCMRKSGVREKYVRVVQNMYEDSVTTVKCAVGTTEWFKVDVFKMGYIGRRMLRMEPPGRRKRGRPRRRFMDVVRKDMQVDGLKELDL